jgi:hypothetical protein
MGYRYSCALPLISALDGVGDQRHVPAILPRERNSVPIIQEVRQAPGPVWTGVENLVPAGIRSPDPPDRCESQHRLPYPGQ